MVWAALRQESDPRTLTYLGNAALVLGEIEEARRCYEEAQQWAEDARSHPARLDALASLAQAEAQLGALFGRWRAARCGDGGTRRTQTFGAGADTEEAEPQAASAASKPRVKPIPGPDVIQAALRSLEENKYSASPARMVSMLVTLRLFGGVTH